MVLVAVGSALGPLGIDSPVCVLMMLEELHAGDWTGGVPGGAGLRISVRLETELSLRDALVLPFAGAGAVDVPLAGPTLAQVELTPPVNHPSPPVPLVAVEVVLPTVLHFLDVDVGAKTEDMAVPAGESSYAEGSEVHSAGGRPLLQVGFLQVSGGGDPCWLQLRLPLRKCREGIRSPLALDFGPVVTSVACPEVISIAHAVSDLFQLRCTCLS